MPIRPPRICSCGKVVASNVICLCQQRRKAEADKRRPSASERGYDSRWSKARAGYLLSHPDCVMVSNDNVCGKPASVVDHIKPHRGDTKLFWDKTNWQSLCAHCHNSRKQSFESRSHKQDR